MLHKPSFRAQLLASVSPLALRVAVPHAVH